MTDNHSPFCDLAEGRARLDAMRAEEQNTSPHEPRPEYVRWIVWARENAEAMLNCIEALAQRSPSDFTVRETPRRYEGKCHASSASFTQVPHFCDLEFGHRGAHQDDSGMSWSRLRSDR